MVSKLGLAARAYYRWAEVAVWDVSIPGSAFRSKVNEVAEQYGFTSLEILKYLDLRDECLYEKAYPQTNVFLKKTQ